MARAAAASLPSTTGKTAEAENFPVASRLLSAKVRRQVMAFYRFARTADDIADNPAFSPEYKLTRLDALERALGGAPAEAAEGHALRAAVAGDETLLGHAALLLQAFRRDAVSDHCRDWGDLMTYCRYSAAPVGRFLLDLHGESSETGPPADALCAALQVLNHLQDCGVDYRALGRVYIPRDWLQIEGVAPDAFAGERAEPDLRAVLDQVLDQVDGLLDLAHALPGRIANRRLRIQAAITLAMAERLSALLRRRDPLAETVKLSPLGYVGAATRGLLIGLGF